MFLAFQLVNIFHLMNDWHKFHKSGVSSTHLCTSNCQNFDWHLVGATTVQKASKCFFHYAFVGLFFWTGSCSILYLCWSLWMNFAFNKREQSSYELKVRESLKVGESFFVDKIFSSSVKTVWKDIRLWSTLAGLLCNKCWKRWEFESVIIRIWQCAWSIFLNLFCWIVEKICG